MHDIVKVEVDEVEKEVRLAVEDETVKQQREMWGEHYFPPFSPFCPIDSLCSVSTNQTFFP